MAAAYFTMEPLRVDVAEYKFRSIYMFWTDTCIFFRQVGVMFFFQDCYWHK